ncbi:hypothetical protein [Limibacterium fermenti]|jgi:hypothetical protein|uniref:hypothetical protein n=1 Tax=Limibacterium fermenti TaxID=3229863 RepID=UPI003A70442A
MRDRILLSQKVFKDIFQFGCCGLFQTIDIPENISNAYNNWIYSLRERASSILLNEEYNYGINEFAKYYPTYASPFNYELQNPNALYELINTSNCN